MIKKTILCDVCGAEMINRAISASDPLDKHNPDVIQVIFETEQDEGHPATKPYLSEQRIDLCKICLDTLLEGNYIYASGAMGYNKYYFK